MFTRIPRSYVLFTAMAVAVLTIARVNDPPNGRTGAPGDGLCTDCHGGGNSGQDGTLTIDGLPADIDPSTTYTLTVTIENPNGLGTHGGFQLVALNAANDDIGSLSGADGNSKITPSGDRTYWEHSPSQTFGSDNTVSYTVDWTSPDGSTDETITLYAAANVSDGNGSTSGDLILTSTSTGELMSSGDPLDISIIESGNVLCAGGNSGFARAEATGGTSPYDYAWSDGQSGDVAVNLEAGTIMVTVTDADNNMASTSVTINEPSPLVVEIVAQEDPSCNGSMDGSAGLSSSGGAGSYEYLWPDGSMDSNNEMLGAGTTTVTVTDANDCETTVDIVLDEPDVLVGAVLNQVNVLCAGGSDGAVELAAAGGTAPYLFEWSNGLIGESQDNLEAGSYTVTLTDFQLCTDLILVDITEPDAIVVSLLDAEDIACHGDSTGLLTIGTAGGTGNLDILWSTGQTSSSITGLTADSYSVTVTDENECSTSMSWTLTESDPIEINISATNESSAGAMDGSVSTDPTGGVSPYTYLWSTGDTTQNLDGLGEGSYTVTVTDANECTATATASVNGVNCTLESEIVSQEIACNAGTTMACVNIIAGSAPFEYIWSDGSTDACISGIGAGDYEVTVTDSDLCTEILSITISEPAAIELNTLVDQPLCNGDLGRIEVFATGGTGQYRYSPSQVLDSLAPGSYTITVTDENDCEMSITEAIQEPAPINIMLDSIVNEDSGNPGTGAVYITASGGTGDLSYEWKDANGLVISTDQNLIDQLAGSYVLTVTDTNDCSASSTYEIELSVSTDQENVVVLELFPNPAQDYVRIKIASDDIRQIRWLGLDGHAQATQVISQSSIYSVITTPETSGLWILEITTENRRYVEKLLIQR